MVQRSCPAPENPGLKISPEYSGRDLAWRIRRKESQEIRRGDRGSQEIRDPRHSPTTAESLLIGSGSRYKLRQNFVR
jgi:hypothetical protein